MITTKFLTPRVSVESTGEYSPQKGVPPFLATIWNICVKHKNAFISTTRNINFDEIFDPREYGESTGNFPQKLLSSHVGGHLDFCLKQKNAFILEWCEIEQFQQNF